METPRKLLETPESRRRYNVARKGERDSRKAGGLGNQQPSFPLGRRSND